MQHPKQHGWQLGVNGRLAPGEAFRATFGENLASRKNRVLLRGNACLDQFPFFTAHLRCFGCDSGGRFQRHERLMLSRVE